MEALLGVQPEVVAHDLHPEYLSSRYARQRPAVEAVAIQHHHAHGVSALAEHGLAGPALAVCFDGTGLGTDDTAWGGEILWVSEERFRRLATLRPLPLAGGDLAVRQVWRQALAALDDAFDGAPPLEDLPLFASLSRDHTALVRRMIAEDLNCPRAHGAGRLFDVVGAILLALPESAFEGQVATVLNLLADPAEKGVYPVPFGTGDPDAESCRMERRNGGSLRNGSGGEILEIDTRPLLRRVVEELLSGRSRPKIAARFHNSLALAAMEAVVHLSDLPPGEGEEGRARRDLPVVLTGGCFQNPLLVQRCLEALPASRELVLHRQVPAGDGGLALGQAVIADRLSRQS
jgi:hydrogenase maturation protein HypF